MEIAILLILVVLAVLLFMVTGRQKKSIRQKREEILRRMKERQFNQKQNESSEPKED